MSDIINDWKNEKKPTRVTINEKECTTMRACTILYTTRDPAAMLRSGTEKRRSCVAPSPPSRTLRPPSLLFGEKTQYFCNYCTTQCL